MSQAQKRKPNFYGRLVVALDSRGDAEARRISVLARSKADSADAAGVANTASKWQAALVAAIYAAPMSSVTRAFFDSVE